MRFLSAWCSVSATVPHAGTATPATGLSPATGPTRVPARRGYRLYAGTGTGACASGSGAGARSAAALAVA